jgi:hypothetical protein
MPVVQGTRIWYELSRKPFLHLMDTFETPSMCSVGIVVGAGNKEVNKIDKDPCCCKLMF